ncbi:MAG: ATP-binding protein [Clostridiales Family XIII bacterium]|nr:ATP-binding protein [Clostridiales Family XIII bacterium]
MNGELLGDFDGEEYFRRYKKGRKPLTDEEKDIIRAKGFFDLILPGTVKFLSDTYISGDKHCCVWAVREYSPTTEEQAVFSQLADREGVTLKICTRPVDAIEQRKIIQNATRKNKLMRGGTDVQETVTAESNLEDVVELISNMRKSKEPLLHTSAYIELRANTGHALKELKSEILMELTRAKIAVDHLTLRQKEGFLSVMPAGYQNFGAQFERVLPASSVANLYPFNYSGKTDPGGFYIGRDKFGTNILVDFDRRSGDKTNASILILGNSGQGKSYLMKLILTNIRESGKRVIIIDAEEEYKNLVERLGGNYLDLLGGEYLVNPLEPRVWSVSEAEQEPDDSAPAAFRGVTRLAQHISYLKDFFRSYKDFSDAQIDLIEMMLVRLYENFGITDATDLSLLKSTDYPIMSDLYSLIVREYMAFDDSKKYLYTAEMLQEISLGLSSMCVGAESKYFNGHTNITDDMFLCFGVKGIMDTNKRLKDTLLFNILSFMTGVLLGQGNAAAAIDELYLYLTNLTAIEYIRNAAKRVRKKDSMLLLASQNVDDFLLEGVREYTKPLFAIPTHHFLFNAGQIEPRAYTDTLQLEPAEFELIKYPERGTCLYRCGNERYLLRVIAPDYKAEMFGDAGGR